MISNSVASTTYFLQEASNLLRQIDNELQTLRQSFSVQKVHTLMRLAHTLKGAAATVGLDAIKTTTQTLENTFKALCVPRTSLTSIVERLIFDSYDCLKLLLSVQLDNTPLNEQDVLERMERIASELRENLGDKFGQNSYLPTSKQLGVDVTHSIFESGVTEYLDELEHALITPESHHLINLLKVQSEVFIGLSESLRLPGLGTIAQATLLALQQHPDQVTKIAQLALVDYRAAQRDVFLGDRNQGGSPSTALKLLGDKPVSLEENWLHSFWQWLNQPIIFSPKSAEPKTLQQTKVASLVAEMQPLDTIFHHCHQVLNELTKQQGKPVHVQIKGGEILIPKTLINQLHRPLLQLTRNAFNQDIEVPAIRRQQGKSTVGTIKLAAKQEEDCLVICVWDDGCGPSSSDISAQVQSKIKVLQGTIKVVYQPKKGTCFTLRIPTEL
ncbi:MAG: hypothetical protein F6K11_11615 [Leptolyngbya sp. SIO3F4]|nr:hypothetical protein [Leptolyngbya sp. SIO3F4]